jgi:signal transduction histidine kinase
MLDDLQASFAAQKESEAKLRRFLADASHELRTPLTSIIGYVQLVLDDEALGRDARRFLQIVHRNGQRLLRLVGDMLFVAQVEAGRLSLDREPVAVRAVVVDGVDAARPAAEDVGVNLEFVEDPSGDPDFVVGDRDRLAQALDNLISNALKFSARNATVTVSLRQADGWVNVEVIDTGDGIPLVEQERLFDRFARSESAIDRGVPGAGLGLAVVKAIVEAHDGSVELESALGRGTTVRLRLPLADQAAVL